MRNQVFVAARDAVSLDKMLEEESVFPVDYDRIHRLGRGALAIVGVLGFAFLMGTCITHNVRPIIYLLPFCGLAITALGMLVITLLANVMSRRYAVRVGEKGITGMTFWDKKITLSWGEIETVEPIRYLGYSYWKITSFRKDRPAMWVPCSLKSPDGFCAAIAHRASPANPLRRYLEDECEVQREPLRW